MTSCGFVRAPVGRGSTSRIEDEEMRGLRRTPQLEFWVKKRELHQPQRPVRTATGTMSVQ